MDHLDSFSDELLRSFFDELRLDTQNFLHAATPFDETAYRTNVAALKAKPLPLQGRPLQDVIHDIRGTILPGSIHQHHKNYIAFPDKGSYAAAQYAAMLSAFTNQNLIADAKSAPTATYVEMLVISWLRELIGYKTSSGIPAHALDLGGAMVTGGTLANTLGLLGARQHAYPESKTEGMMALRKTPKIFVAGSTISHYSHYGASWWLGFGTDNVVEVACDSQGRMDQTDLSRKLADSLSRGAQPVAIVAVMGDSRTNTLEDLPGLYHISQRFGVWLHADACHGGVLAFDQQATTAGKHILSYADSIAMDPHKQLGAPYSSSVILFKDPKHLAAIGSSTDITIARGSSDIGQITPFLGSKPFDALKLYALFEALGVDGICKSIHARQQITKHWHTLLAESEHFMPLHTPDLFAQAFTLKPGRMNADQLSEKNAQLHDTLYTNGTVVVNKFSLRDYRNLLPYGRGNKITCLGSTIGSDAYTDDDLRAMLHVLEQTTTDIG